MIKQDLIKIYALVKTLWHNYEFPRADIDLRLHDATWYQLFKEYDTNFILYVIREYSKTSEFFNVGIIAGKCEELTKPQLQNEINEQDIFNEINKAITLNIGYEEWDKLDKYKHINSPNNPYLAKVHYCFDKLSPIAKRIVGSPQSLWEMGQINTADFNTVTKSNILRVAKVLLEKQKKNKKNKELLNTYSKQKEIDHG